MSDKTSIFSNEHNESPVQVIRHTMAVSLDDDGTPLVSFAMNRGKGSGAQTLPVEEYREYVETLGTFADNGIPETAEQEMLSASETVRRTIKNEDGIISFRVRSGKGAKPAKLPASDFSEVVDLLRGTLEAVCAAGNQLTVGDDEIGEDA